MSSSLSSSASSVDKNFNLAHNCTEELVYYLNLQGFYQNPNHGPSAENVTSSDHARCTNDTKEEARVDRALEPVDDQKKSSS